MQWATTSGGARLGMTAMGARTPSPPSREPNPVVVPMAASRATAVRQDRARILRKRSVATPDSPRAALRQSSPGIHDSALPACIIIILFELQSRLHFL